MIIRNFANPNHVCEMCNRHFSVQIKTQSYITFPGLIELKTHNTHQWCDVFKYNRKNAKKMQKNANNYENQQVIVM